MQLDDLVRAIESSPDDVDAYLVLADALQEAGNPLGELIVLQHQLANDVGNDDIANAIESHLKKYRNFLTNNLKLDKMNIHPEYHLGFWRSVRILPSMHDTTARLKAVLELPVARFVQKVVVFTHHVDSFDGPLPTTLDEVQFPKCYDDIEEALESTTPVRWLQPNLSDNLSLERFLDVEVLDLYLDEAPMAELERLPKLRKLCLSGRLLRSLTPEILALPNLRHIDTISPLPQEFQLSRINAMLESFALAQTPPRRRRIEANMALGQDEAAWQVAETEDLLMALDNKTKRIRESALRGLASRLPSEFADRPVANSEIAVLGSIALRTSELRARLKQQSIRLVSKVSARTTHVVLGDRPRGKQRKLPEDLPMYLESSLLPLFEQQKKTPNDEELDIQALSTLLQERSASSDAEAIAILEKSGLPDELLLELLVVAHDSSIEGPSRKHARKVFSAFAPTPIQAAENQHLKPGLFTGGATVREARARAFCEATGLSLLRLAKVLMGRARLGGNIIFREGDASDRKWLLDHLLAIDSQSALAKQADYVAGEFLDLSDLHLTVLPPEITQLRSLRALNLDDNRFEGVPSELLDFPRLEWLSFENNRLSSLPHELEQLHHLKYLDLGRNQFKRFPLSLCSLVGLEELNLSDQRGNPKISPPDKIHNMHSLRRLHLAAANIAKFPPGLFLLPELEELNLHNSYLPETMPAEFTKLPKLRTLCGWDASKIKPPLPHFEMPWHLSF